MLVNANTIQLPFAELTLDRLVKGVFDWPFLVMFNALYTTPAIVCTAILDQDVPARRVIREPVLYLKYLNGPIIRKHAKKRKSLAKILSFREIFLMYNFLAGTQMFLLKLLVKI